MNLLASSYQRRCTRSRTIGVVPKSDVLSLNTDNTYREEYPPPVRERRDCPRFVVLLRFPPALGLPSSAMGERPPLSFPRVRAFVPAPPNLTYKDMTKYPLLREKLDQESLIHGEHQPSARHFQHCYI